MEFLLGTKAGETVNVRSNVAATAAIHREGLHVPMATIAADTPHDIIVFGAMLAQPRPPDPDWDATCRRLLTTYLQGLRR